MESIDPLLNDLVGCHVPHIQWRRHGVAWAGHVAEVAFQILVNP